MVGTLFVRATVIGLVVVLAGVGCGGAEPGGPGGGGPGPAVEVTGGPNPGVPTRGEPAPGRPIPDRPGEPGPGGSDPDNPNPDNPAPAPPEVAWVPPGPGSSPGIRPGPPPDTDPSTRWDEAFQDRDCTAIAALGPERDQRQLYRGLGAACQAALKDEDQLWPAAERALQRVGDPTSCRDRSALRLLRALVAAHQRAPNTEIRIVDPPAGRKCGSGPTSVSPTPSVAPSSGPSVPGEPTQPTAPSGPPSG